MLSRVKMNIVTAFYPELFKTFQLTKDRAKMQECISDVSILS